MSREAHTGRPPSPVWVSLPSAVVLAGIETPLTVARARPLDQFRFQEQVDEVIDGYCPGETVHLEAGQAAAFTLAWNYIDQEMRVTDDGDGALSSYPSRDGSGATCLRESNSVDDVRSYVDGALGDSSRNQRRGSGRPSTGVREEQPDPQVGQPFGVGLG